MEVAKQGSGHLLLKSVALKGEGHYDLQLSMTFGEIFFNVNFGIGFIVPVLIIWLMVGLIFNVSEKKYEMSLTFLGNQGCDQ